jgi:hypothetical protein
VNNVASSILAKKLGESKVIENGAVDRSPYSAMTRDRLLYIGITVEIARIWFNHLSEPSKGNDERRRTLPYGCLFMPDKYRRKSTQEVHASFTLPALDDRGVLKKHFNLETGWRHYFRFRLNVGTSQYKDNGVFA